MNFGRTINHWILDPVRKLLVQGLTPNKLAWSVSLGIMVGVFPVIGSTFLLCAATGAVFRLNQPTLQSANYAMYPAQFILLIPFYELGATIFSADLPTRHASEVVALIRLDMLHAIALLWTTTWHAAVAWGLCAIPAVVLIYVPISMLFRRIAESLQPAENAPLKRAV